VLELSTHAAHLLIHRTTKTVVYPLPTIRPLRHQSAPWIEIHHQIPTHRFSTPYGTGRFPCHAKGVP
jgi:hypothetical protein